MPFDDTIVSMPLYNPTGLEKPPEIQGPPMPPPTFGGQLASVYRQSNIVASAIANRVTGDRTVDNNFDLYNGFIKGNPDREKHWERYVAYGAFNEARALSVERQIQMEEDDRKNAAALPWYLRFPAEISAGLTDPTVLFPAGGAVRAAGTGFSVLRSALLTGSAVGAGIAVQEAGLQATQATRPISESFENIAVGVLFGGVLGGSVAKLMNKSDAAISEAALRGLVPGGEVFPPPLPKVEFEIRAPRALDDIVLTAANDKPAGVRTNPWFELEPISGTPKGVMSGNSFDTHATNVRDEHGFLFRNHAEQTGGKLSAVPAWFTDVKDTLKQLSEELGAVSPRIFTGTTRKNQYGYQINLNPGTGFHSIIVLDEKLNRKQALAISLHEFGHALQAQKLENATPDIQRAIKEAWVKYAEEAKSPTTKIEQIRPVARIIDEAYAGTFPNKNHRAYLTKFEEWFADQTSQWLMRNTQPTNTVERWFKGMADMWRKLFESVTGHVGVSKEVDDFMRGLWQGPKPKDVAEVTMPGSAVNQPFMNRRLVQLQPANDTLPSAVRDHIDGKGLGADVTQGLPPEATQIQGSWVNAIGGAFGWMVPSLRATQWMSPYARQLFQSMFDGSLTTMGNKLGLTAAPGGSIARRAQQFENLKNKALEQSIGHYQDMLKSGVKMTHDDFGEAIGIALSNADKALDGNEFVTKAAQAWRNIMFNPLLKAGVDVGVFKLGTEVTTAESYFPRQAIRQSFIENEGLWMERNVPWWEEKLRTSYAANLEKVQAQIRRLDEQAGDLGLGAEAAVAKVAEINATRSQLDAAFPRYVEMRDALDEARSQLRAAKKEGNAAAVAGLTDTINGLKADPGFKEFLKSHELLGTRQRFIERGFGGTEMKAQQMADQLADIEEASMKSLQRLIKRGQETEKKLARLDPDELGAEIDKLHEGYMALINRDEKSMGRRQIAIATIEERANKQLEKAAKDAERARSGQVEDPTVKGGLTPDEIRIAAERDLKLAEQMKLEWEASAKRLDQIKRAAERLDDARSFDLDQAYRMIQMSNAELVQNVSSRQLSLGEKAAKLKERIAARTPEVVEQEIKALTERRSALEKRFYDRWERDALGEGVDIAGKNAPKFTDLARDISQSAFNKYTGRWQSDGGVPQPDYLTIITKGPFNGRPYNVPDFVLDPPGDPRKFFHRNVYDVAPIHARQMSGDIAIAQVHGDPAMREIFGETGVTRGKLGESYDALRKIVLNAETPEEALKALGQDPTMRERLAAWRGQDVKKVTQKRLLSLLDQEERSVRADMEIARDTVRGTYLVDANSTNYARAVRLMNGFNYLTKMGGLGLSMLTDLYRPAMVRGLAPWLRDGLAPLAQNSKAFELLTQEAKDAGLIMNKTSQMILSSLADLGDPMARGTPMERLIDKLTRHASVWNGSRIMQDFMEGVGSRMTQMHLIRSMATPESRAANIEYLTKLGLDPSFAERVSINIAKHGETIDGIRVPNTERWTQGLEGDALRRAETEVMAYRTAVKKEVDGMFSTRQAGDVPWFMQSPTGKMLLQFNSFNIASFSNVLLAGLQGNKAQLAHSIIAMTSMGMLVAYFQAAAGGKERLEKFQRNIADNPMFWVAEGLDKSGIFAVPFWGANAVESATAAAGQGRINPIKNPLMHLGGRLPQELQTTGSGRDIVTALGGPTIGMLSNVPRAAGAAITLGQGDSPKKQQAQALQQMIPGGTYIGFRQLIQAAFGDLPGR